MTKLIYAALAVNSWPAGCVSAYLDAFVRVCVCIRIHTYPYLHTNGYSELNKI